MLENNNIIISIEKLKKYFVTRQGLVRAVDEVSFSIKKGETFGLIGESGSGKSTVAYTIIGMYKPTEGKILYYRGQDILDIGKRCTSRSSIVKKEIQIVFQDPSTSLNPKRSIKQILELPLKTHGLIKSSNDGVRQVEKLLMMVNLPLDYMYKYPRMIGGGERQLVAIARALATNPSFIVLDEPTSALDVSIQAKIINTLIQLREKLKLSCIFITHDLSLMRNLASRVAIMYLGKICEISLTDELYTNPLHPYTQMLFSSIPVISEEEEKFKPKKIKSVGEIPSPVNIPSGCSFHSRCPWGKKICTKEEPKMLEIKKGRFVKCHLYE